ncbi:MAG TPA: AmmeMemoRadiSam system protein B [Anaerolineales bacterium]|nr:AmmeMemoRadiSam system protein B [Anaerolineales bacterium]
MTYPNIRPSPIAGTWYPGQPAPLRAEISRYLAGVGEPIREGKLHAIIVPHAGYYYSGPVAAHAFACLRGLHPDLVAVVSPLHSPHPAAVLTSAYDAYATPLGPVEVDRKSIARVDQALRPHLGSGLFPLAKDPEHSLEIELPFLQHLLGEFHLLPIMLRDQRWETARAVGDALAEVLTGKNVLLVASSDLSHFYPQPVAKKLDGEILSRIEALDPEGIIKADDEGLGFACGRGAIAAVLWAACRLGANQARVLHHATSGDVNGDFDRVVGYGAAVVLEVNTSHT